MLERLRARFADSIANLRRERTRETGSHGESPHSAAPRGAPRAEGRTVDRGPRADAAPLMPGPVNLAEKFSLFSDYWKPRWVGECNGQHVRIAKFKGQFGWHHHADEDELFLIAKGEVILHLRTGDVRLSAGEFYVVPRGIEHNPEAPEEAHVILIEPAATRNTGNVRNHRTVEEVERI